MIPTPTLRRFLAAALAGSALTAAQAHAAAFSWNGSAGLWSTTTAWNPTVGTTLTSSDDVTFDSTATANFTTALGGANQSVRSVTFNSATSYTVRLYSSTTATTTERVLSLGTGGITVSAGNHTIFGPKGGNNTTGALRMGSGTASNIPFDIASGASLTFDARLRQVSTPTYTKSGAGTLVFTGDNSGTSGWSFAAGGFTVSEGVLRFTASGAYGTSGVNYAVSSGAALELAGGVSQTVNGGTITLKGSGIGGNGALRSVSGDNTITGTQASGVGGIPLAENSSIGVDAGSLAINQVVSGAFNLTKVGTGTLALSGANTYSGGTTVSAGALSFRNTGAKPASGTHAFAAGTTLGLGVSGASPFIADDIANAFAGTMTGNLSNVTVDATTNVGIDTTGGDFTFGTAITGNPAKSLVKLGTNFLTLTGPQTYAGGTIISAGTLQFAQTTSMPAAGAVAVQSGATLAVNAGGTGEFTNATSGNGSIGGLLAGLGGQSGGTVSYTGNLALGIDTTNAGASLAYAGPIGNVGSTLGITKLGNGTLTLTGANTYTGATTIRGGTLEVQGSISGSSGITNNAALVLNSASDQSYGLNITGTGSLTVAGTGTTTLAVDTAYTGTTTVSAGILQIGTGGATGTLGNQSNTSIASGALLRIERDAAATYAYSGTLSGSGTVQIPAGRRMDFITTNQTSSGNLSFAIDGILAIRTNANGTVTAVQLGELTGTGTVQRGSTAGGAATVFIGGKNTSSTYAGVITTAELSVEKTGTGILALTGSSGYGGSTNVSAGTLALGNATNTLPNTTAVSLGAATLSIGAACADTVGTLDVTGTATINLGSNNSALVFANSSAVGGGTWAGTLNLTGTFVPGASINFGVDGLSGDQLAKISAAGWTSFALDGDGFLTAIAVSGSSYASWATLNGAGDNLADDHDNDGVDNGTEYFLGGPTGNTTGFTPLPGVTNTAGILSVKWTKGAGYTGTYGPAADYVVETSDTLAGPWTQEASPGNVTLSGNDVIYTFPSPLGTRKFARLKVTGP
ncbi:MAG: autotransporter-associated beta strand repeat-containing protein [Akkermansiaceae bacterium]|jgi:autotransporter-associated beta strand protein|nr:autotransporter-associated beta strand repeat-containing protein [Akkermansiaceae bacterium]